MDNFFFSGFSRDQIKKKITKGVYLSLFRIEDLKTMMNQIIGNAD